MLDPKAPEKVTRGEIAQLALDLLSVAAAEIVRQVIDLLLR